MSVFAFLFQMYRATVISFGWIEVIQSVMIASIWPVVAARKRLSLRFKSTYVAAASASVAYLGIIKYGLMAAGFSIIPMTALVFALYFSQRTFTWFYAFNVFFLGLMAMFYTTGVMNHIIPSEFFITSFSHWMMFVIASMFVVYFIGVSVLEYKKELGLVVQEITEQRQMMEKLASYDQLTGLSLMTFAEKKIEKLIAERAEHSHVAVMFLDVDNFKTINDHYGHDAGDRCLKFIANAIKSVIRDGDEACRIGGDEMVVICDQIKSDADALELSNRLAQHVAAGFLYKKHHIPVSVSIGVAIAPFHSNKFSELRRCADYAMYQAKKNHNNHVVMYSR